MKEQGKDNRNENASAKKNARHHQIGIAEKADENIAAQKENKQNERDNFEDGDMKTSTRKNIAQAVQKAEISGNICYHDCNATNNHSVNHKKHTDIIKQKLKKITENFQKSLFCAYAPTCVPPQRFPNPRARCGIRSNQSEICSSKNAEKRRLFPIQQALFRKIF